MSDTNGNGAHPERAHLTETLAMNAHDVGREGGGPGGAFRRLAEAGVSVHGVGIAGDILYGPRQVRALVEAAAAAGVTASYREIASDKGHDAFLVEWDQLAGIIGEALAADADREQVAASA